jgi:phosphohistidine swiveling domain-containing protein
MFTFSSKANTLAALSGKLKSARVLPLVHFTVAQWNGSQETILKNIDTTLGDVVCIIRSSCQAEDTHSASNAGAFLSVAGICGKPLLRSAISQVIESYGAANDANQVLVQPELQDVALCGVVLTREPATGAQYFIINYDKSGATDGVTGGKSGAMETFVCSKSAAGGIVSPMDKVIALARELETLTGCDHLDIEFAITKDGECVLLQVRPLVIKADAPMSCEAQQAILATIEQKISEGMRPHPHLHGARTAYGVMPDWNPAEIIGIRPRPLALSLYRDLVTDSIWSYQRNNYGYKNLRSFPLMVHFFGLPYIDVRVSMNSFIPGDIGGDLADRLANYYLDRLIAAPSLHDKVEFEIVFSCYTLDLPLRLETLRAHGFSEEDIATLSDSLRKLTNNIIRPETGLWRVDKDKTKTLQDRHKNIMDSDLSDIERIYWLLEDCKRYGTLPFAGLARAAFIAVQMIQSLVTEGILTPSERDRFIGDLNTVSSQITRDFAAGDREAFLTKYGHLRPGTYDILSPRYDEAADYYFDWGNRSTPTPREMKFALSVTQMKEISQLLSHHKLDYDIVGLLEFIGSAIEWREQSKFLFTKNLSDALQIFTRLGEAHGFSADDLSYASIGVIHELYAAGLDIRATLAESIARGKAQYENTLQLRLPPLITAPSDAWSFFAPPSEPNFITQKNIAAAVVHHSDKSRLAGAIAVIESADPGFDWLFSHNIAGLITAYGGANSHMAIRAGELGLPAVIGAGETLFSQWSKAKMLKVDCANRRVEVVR